MNSLKKLDTKKASQETFNYFLMVYFFNIHPHSKDNHHLLDNQAKFH